MATMSSICVGSCCVARRRPRIATGAPRGQRRSKATQSSMSAGHGYWGTRGRRCGQFSRVPPRHHHHQCPRMQLRRRRRQRRGLRAHGAPRLCGCGIRARALSPCPGRIHSSVQAAISHLAPHLVTAGQTAEGSVSTQTGATKIWMAAFTARLGVTGTELLQWRAQRRPIGAG